jgi:FixJ family two-component response regulator
METDLASDSGRTKKQPVIGSIGVVDDDESVRVAISSLVRSAGYKCEMFPSAEAFLDSGPETTDCLVLDVRMPGMNGIELCGRLRDMNLRVPVIFVTGHPNDRVRERALKQGAVAFFSKPFDDDAFLTIIQSAIDGATD